MKETADEVVVLLEPLHQANIPDDWQEAMVTPVFKGGNKDHRVISLKSITYKNLTRIIHSNLISHLDQQRKLKGIQYGFYKN